jgi:uncharacterized membrane protein YoaK (UPF0700 family)
VFVSQAHSFVQQARLAITLAWVAGYTNIISILACGHVTSHTSGTTSDLGRAVAEGHWPQAAFFLFLLLTFGSGAMLSGFLTEHGRRRGWESIYVLPIAVEALLLAAFAVTLEALAKDATRAGAPRYLLTGLAATAMGLQNATITRISSGVVRTTHVTGVLTDLGLEFAQFLLWIADRRRDVPPGSATALVHTVQHHPTATRLALLASILGSFALGTALGTLAYDSRLAPWAMFPPVLFLIWIVYQDVVRPIAEIEPSTLVTGDHALDDRLAVFHLRRELGKPNGTHRMPNLQAWADRLPPAARVVILDLGGVTRLDTNSALELRAVLAQMRRQGRQMLLAGLDHAQVTQLRRAGVGDLLTPDQVCPDLDLAIAQGLNLLR